MRKLLLLAVTVAASMTSYAQTVTWPMNAESMETFTWTGKVGNMTETGNGDLRVDAAQVGNGLSQGFRTDNGTTIKLSPTEEGVNTLDDAVSKKQTLSVGIANNSYTHNYFLQAVEFDIAVSSPNVRVNAVTGNFMTTAYRVIKNKNLISDDIWAGVTKNNTFQHVTITMPEDIQTAEIYMGGIDFVIYNASTLDQVSIKNVTFNLSNDYSSTPTSINGLSLNVSDNAKAYNINGQAVNKNYKGLVIKNGRKHIQK